MIDLSDRLGDPAVRGLLAEVIYPDPGRVDEACRRYRDEPSWRLFGWERDGELAGVAGIELGAPGEATLRHIAVHKELRARGLGRQMLRELIQRYALTTLVAETDAGAVGFYRRCGFAIESLGRALSRCGALSLPLARWSVRVTSAQRRSMTTTGIWRLVRV